MRKRFCPESFRAEAAAIRAERIARERQALRDRLSRLRSSAKAERARLERQIAAYDRVLEKPE